jgi:formate dehydrogenase gamma subunit
MRRAMMIDLDRCIGCSACVSACKEGWDVGVGATRNWVRTVESGRRGEDLGVSFYVGLCMQCEDHPCTTDCPSGATFMNERGVVTVDPDLCIGCGNCVSNCPYGARTIDRARGIVQKCNLCEPFAARGEEPFCVATCPADARIAGDLDDPASPLATAIRARNARPLRTDALDFGPKVTFAGDVHRERLLASGVIRRPERSALTAAWTGGARPLAAAAVPALAAVAVAGGVAVNLLHRRREVEAREAARATDVLPRHRLGMRLLHWFNALSWVLLLATGTGLLASASFAPFGTAFPRWLAGVFGGAANLLRFHALYGLAWAATIVPAFLLWKRGGGEALAEIRLRRDDLAWLARKPLAMLGLSRAPLPPQDKYNAGQKLFAGTALAGTATIIGTGVVMTFHLGPAAVVAAAILLHGLAIALALVGLAVHLTMAAILGEERPALRSMVVGTIDRDHARTHNARWVEELEGEEPAAGGTPRRHG